ncbi:MFS transporter [Saccharopolyspora elongata]|uniref:MFS transporter n=1 Tax=Saccharopolyspora elongata TaxID=2530387 RepID=A0A4R4YEW8_9PSEU|nr:MFS transporter [Saccharopolyspora elongata]TDD42454.1 MFS transporter [Saccharopolyspora elongata]
MGPIVLPKRHPRLKCAQSRRWLGVIPEKENSSMSQHPMADTSATSAAPLKTKVATVVGFLLFVEFSSGFLQGYYGPLFGEMIPHWGITDANITWFVTVQTLAAGVSVPVLAKLGDIYGHRRILRISVIAVAIGAALVALSPSFEIALVGRVLCGPLAVWLPLEIGIAHSRLVGDTSRRAIGMLVACLTLGAVVGSLAAGQAGHISNLTVVLLLPVIMLVLRDHVHRRPARHARAAPAPPHHDRDLSRRRLTSRPNPCPTRRRTRCHAQRGSHRCPRTTAATASSAARSGTAPGRASSTTPNSLSTTAESNTPVRDEPISSGIPPPRSTSMVRTCCPGSSTRTCISAFLTKKRRRRCSHGSLLT